MNASRALLLVALSAVPCQVGCVSLLPGGDLPPLRLFTVVADPPLAPMLPLRDPVRLRVHLFEVDSLVQRTEILVRKADHPSDVRYLPTDRWADFPAVLVTECVREHLNASGGVGTVLPHKTRGRFDATLRGRILRFEAVEGAAGDWSASLVLDLSVERTDGEETLLERIVISEGCAGSEPGELAVTMSAAIREAAHQALPQIRIALQDGDFRPAIPFEPKARTPVGMPPS